MTQSYKDPTRSPFLPDLESDKKVSHKAKSSGFSFDSKEIFEVAQTLLKNGIPTSVCSICEYVSGLVCLRFAGKYGTAAELAGVALGFTWNGMFGLGLISGINQGFSVLASQLYGARKYRELGILLQRNIFVLSLLMIPLLLSFYFADVILIGLGLDYEVSINTGIYLKHAMPSLIGLAFFECLRFYLISQNCFYVQSMIQGGLSIVHIFWCYLFVDVLDMPVAGIGIAKSITDLSCGLLLCLYVKYNNVCPESWIPWERTCMDNWFPYLKQTAVLGANLYVEWVSYEVSLVVASMLNDPYALGAHGIAITLFCSFYMLPLGNSYTMQAYVGNSVGEGSIEKGKKFMVAGLGLTVVMALMNMAVLIGWSNGLAQFFTEDDQTQVILRNMILIYASLHIVDTLVSPLTGVLKILGKEKEVLKFFLFSYLGVGITFEWFFGVYMGYGYRAIWISCMFGMLVMCSWAAIKVVRLDWELEVSRVQEKIDEFGAEEKGIYIEMEEK